MMFKIRTLSWCLVLVVLSVATTVAHMAFSKSITEADAVLSESPRQLQVWFTQAPDPVVSQVTLKGSTGNVELGGIMIHDDKSIMAMVPSVLSNGQYTVNWRAAGDDGHTQRGNFAFTVTTGN